ncbi:MAG: family 20 glycosylhydrolase [Agathobacter sp.]|nr:family 20 glycosylhydrolase [Agathobacter sp.]
METNKEYLYRSLHLDCVRHFFPVSTVKKVIEGISYGNMNVLHWHLSDDHGWRIESKEYPNLHEVSGAYYTQEEIREVVAYAKERGIEVVPEIDMPGHNLALLSAYPEYSCKGEPVTPAKARGVYRTILCAGQQCTLDFIEELLEEIIPLFDSRYFHIGGDEAPKDEWKKCPNCNGKMRELGLTSYEDLQGYFTGQVCEILRRHGKTPICWNDALLASNIPEDVVIQYWTIDYAKEMVPFIEKQGKWIYSDMFELYLDYPHSMIPLKKIYEFVPHLYRYPIPDSHTAEKENGLIGFEACCWTEHIETEKELCEHIFPRVYALAERASGIESKDYEAFKTRLREKIKLLEAAGIPYTPEEWWDPKGKARRKDAIKFYLNMSAGVDEEEKKKQAASAAPKLEFVLHFVKEFFKPQDFFALLKAVLFGSE